MDFIDLKKQQEQIRKKIEKRIQSVLDHGKYIMGPEVLELEDKLEQYVGVKHCISCSSGTDALLMALHSLNLKKGDEVITTPNTWYSTIASIIHVGLVPKFIDIKLDQNFNEDLIEALILAVLATPIIGLRFLFEQTTGNFVNPSADLSPLYISRALEIVGVSTVVNMFKFIELFKEI